MFRNYIIVTYRNLIRQKVFSTINIMGLAIGMAIGALVGLYVWYEFSYDRFFKDSGKIYRIALDFKTGTSVLKGPVSPAIMASEIMTRIPEVEDASRLLQWSNQTILAEGKIFYDPRFFYADSNVFEFFGIHLIAGNIRTALARPNSLVITSETSKKLFGTTQSLGKTIQLIQTDTSVYEITGVMESLPENAHIHWNYLASLCSKSDSRSGFWLSNNYYTYLKMKEGTSIPETEKKITDLFMLEAGQQLKQYFNLTPEEYLKKGNKCNYHLQSLLDIHLHSDLNFEIEQNGSLVNVYLFITAAIFILICACINYTNLTTARSTGRAREIGLRKVSGSGKGRIVFQFLTEAVLLCYLAVFIALLLLEIFLPYFNRLLNVHIILSLSDYLILLPWMILFATFTGILSGSYPAFFMSSFQPEIVLKNKFLAKRKGNWLRNTLVIIQFTASIMVFLCTLLISDQLYFIQNKKLGFDKEQVLVIEHLSPVRESMSSFMEELKKCPDIEGLSVSTDIPGRTGGDQGYMMDGKNGIQAYVIDSYGIGYDFIPVMGIKIKQGRNFSTEFGTDFWNVIINESCVRYLGITDPVGKELIEPTNSPEGKRKLKIIGVFEDFHFESLHKTVKPLLFYLNYKYYDGYLNIRFAKGKEKEALEYTALTWKNLTGDSPFHYYYFNDQYKTMYKSEIETQKIMHVFSITTIIIAALGLFALVAFMTESRTKEIGVRKVLGASVWEIIILIGKDISILVLVSFLIASILAWFWMQHWLLNFAYQTPIHGGVFILAFIVSILIAWLTISYIALKAATKNPIEALRYE